MGRERTAAYLRAIEAGEVDEALPSRRQRHKVLAVDSDGDVAAVLAASRGKRHGRVLTTLHYRRVDQRWTIVGESSAGWDDPRFPERNSVPHDGVTFAGRGWTRASRRRGAINDVALRAGHGIVALRWGGRVRPISPTGFAVVAWSGRRMPDVAGIAADGATIARFTRRDIRRRRVPWSVRVRWELLRWRAAEDDWFNDAPRSARRSASAKDRRAYEQFPEPPADGWEEIEAWSHD